MEHYRQHSKDVKKNGDEKGLQLLTEFNVDTLLSEKVCLWCLEAGGGVVGAIKLIFKAIVWGPSC